jgi:hypothetical protein
MAFGEQQCVNKFSKISILNNCVGNIIKKLIPLLSVYYLTLFLKHILRFGRVELFSFVGWLHDFGCGLGYRFQKTYKVETICREGLWM